jgi:hypothetical protein
MTEETDGGKLAVTVQLDQCSTAAGGGVQRCSSFKSHSGGGGGVGLLPPSGGLAQEGPVRWHDGTGILGNGSKVLTSKRMGKSSYL